MRITRKIALPCLMTFASMVACQQEELETPDAVNSESFVAGNLATVKIAEDFEVTFAEPAPGVIMTVASRSIEADQQAAPEIFEILRGDDYVDMYKKLAGKSANPLSLNRLQSATARYKFRQLDASVINADLLKGNLADNETTNTSARTQATCSGGDTGSQWFVEHKVNRTAGNAPGVPYGHALDQSSYSQFVSTTSNTKFEIDIMNGQANNSGNKIRYQFSNLYSYTIDDWTVSTFTLGANTAGTVSVKFTNGLNCKSSHIAFHGFNL